MLIKDNDVSKGDRVHMADRRRFEAGRTDLREEFRGREARTVQLQRASPL